MASLSKPRATTEETPNHSSACSFAARHEFFLRDFQMMGVYWSSPPRPVARRDCRVSVVSGRSAVGVYRRGELTPSLRYSAQDGAPPDADSRVGLGTHRHRVSFINIAESSVRGASISRSVVSAPSIRTKVVRPDRGGNSPSDSRLLDDTESREDAAPLPGELLSGIRTINIAFHATPLLGGRRRHGLAPQ